MHVYNFAYHFHSFLITTKEELWFGTFDSTFLKTPIGSENKPALTDGMHAQAIPLYILHVHSDIIYMDPFNLLSIEITTVFP